MKARFFRRRRAIFALAGMLVSIAASLSAGLAGAGELGDLFREGNTLYAQGRFDEAAGRFERILDHGAESAAVHYNLGNCRFKLGRLAEALVQYEKAARLAPADADTSDNIAIVRSMLGEKPEPPAPWTVRQVEKLTRILSPGAMLWVAAGSYLAVNLIAAIVIVRGRRAETSAARIVAAAVIGAVFLWSAGSSAATAWRSEAVTEAVVLAPDTGVLSAPAEGSAALFTLPLGHKVRVRAAAEGWVHVSIESGWHGWVPSSALGEI